LDISTLNNPLDVWEQAVQFGETNVFRNEICFGLQDIWLVTI